MDTISIAACVFVMPGTNGKLKTPNPESVYFYLNSIGATVDSICVVNSPNHPWNLVRVARVIPANDASAAHRVTKPLMAIASYTEEAAEAAAKAVREFRSKGRENITQVAIDVALGKADAGELLLHSTSAVKTPKLSTRLVPNLMHPDYDYDLD